MSSISGTVYSAACKLLHSILYFWCYHLEVLAVGEVAKLPDRNSAYSDAELRVIAREEYVRRKDRHLNRIARLVGKPVSVLEAWRDEENWALLRAQAWQSEEDLAAAEIQKILKDAGVPDSRDAAISTLKACEKAARAVDNCLDKTAQHTAPEYLDKILSAMERIEKIRKEAYTRL
ncbi:MAG: hypothetical protein IT343_01670 [Candidatus Melainabacteria bacterium]|nr:hypothetical protein [Candidatus Melainabacteria bacterium]